jgi:hypothetical protein
MKASANEQFTSVALSGTHRHTPSRPYLGGLLSMGSSARYNPPPVFAGAKE